MGFADLPSHIQCVWHGVNDPANLRQFLASDVAWAELDVNLDPDGRRLMLRHDTFAVLPRWSGEQFLYLEEALPRLLDRGKSIKLDFKVGGHVIWDALRAVDATPLGTDRLWLNGDLDVLDEAVIQEAAVRYPGAIIQVPLHSVTDQLGDLGRTESRLADLVHAGVNRFSVGWRYPDVPGIAQRLREWGYAFNIYGVADLEEFLQAVELRPDAVTADFNFPAWGYYGRGSGHAGRHYAYDVRIETH